MEVVTRTLCREALQIGIDIDRSGGNKDGGNVSMLKVADLMLWGCTPEGDDQPVYSMLEQLEIFRGGGSRNPVRLNHYEGCISGLHARYIKINK